MSGSNSRKFNKNAVLESRKPYALLNEEIDKLHQILGEGNLGGGGGSVPFVVNSKDQDIIADGARGVQDTSGLEGWYYKNSDNPSEKINWYFINKSSYNSSMTSGSLSGMYAVFFVYNAAVAPYFNFYTKRKNDGQDHSWYRSRVTYNNPNAFSGYTGQRVILYWGEEPDIFPDYPKIELTLDTDYSNGPQESDEEIFLGSLSTSTNYPPSTFDFTAMSLGYYNDGKNYNLPCIAHTDVSQLSLEASQLQSYLTAVRVGKFFRGYVMDETEMLDLSSPFTFQYVARVDTETIWEYDGTDWYDTLVEASVSGIALEEQEVLTYSNTMYIHLDGNDDEIEYLNAHADFLDFNKTWGLSLEVEDVSTINDNSYTTVFSRGKNEICLRKGGSNWGLYLFIDGVSVAQSNTWHDPEGGDKLYFTCDGTKVQYFLNGNRRANVTLNQSVLSNNDPSGNLYIGKGGSQGSHWYGGINNNLLMLGTSALFGKDELAEFFNSEDVTAMSFYPSAHDFVLLGERPYPNVLGLKGNIEGVLKNGTESNYRVMPIPGEVGIPFVDYPGQYVKLDGTDNYLEYNNADTDILDWTKQWCANVKVKSVSGVNDQSNTILYKRGDNEITLKKGGTNWGIYIYAGNTAIAQANTWYAPTFGSSISFKCDGNKLEYFLNGFRRACLYFNSNVSNNNPSGNLLFGKNGLNGGYWYGGIESSFFAVGAQSQISTADIIEFKNNSNPEQLSYYDNILDYINHGSSSYPDLIGLKNVLNGELKKGTPEDFVDNI